jgi:hypothetical protein
MALALGGWLWLRGKTQVTEQPRVTTVAATPQPQLAGVTDTPGDGFGLITGPATPWAVAGGPGEAAATEAAVPPTSTPGAAAPIMLKGPPPNSVFQIGDTVSFYWDALGEPAPNRRYTLYLIVDDERLTLGTVSELNLGQGYQFQAPVGEVVGQAGNYSWLVVLEDESIGAIIGQSETRPISILGND